MIPLLQTELLAGDKEGEEGESSLHSWVTASQSGPPGTGGGGKFSFNGGQPLIMTSALVFARVVQSISLKPWAAFPL